MAYKTIIAIAHRVLLLPATFRSELTDLKFRFYELKVKRSSPMNKILIFFLSIQALLIVGCANRDTSTVPVPPVQPSLSASEPKKDADRKVVDPAPHKESTSHRESIEWSKRLAEARPQAQRDYARVTTFEEKHKRDENIRKDSPAWAKVYEGTEESDGKEIPCFYVELTDGSGFHFLAGDAKFVSPTEIHLEGNPVWLERVKKSVALMAGKSEGTKLVIKEGGKIQWDGETSFSAFGKTWFEGE